MKTIQAPNINQAFVEGFWWLKVAGVLEDSRNGPVLVAPGPVCTTYLRPTERVLTQPKRDANPVFHLLESIWMLAGGHYVDFLVPFNARMVEYAEPNGIIHGAYGNRWRNHFGADQLHMIVDILCADPESRRAVLTMWDPEEDLARAKRDVPCNTHIYFDCRGGKLNMTVCCRSNDMLWGAYGANVVHMSILQELIAAGVGVPVGVYHQFSNNFHMYTEVKMVQDLLSSPPAGEDPYLDPAFRPMPLVWGDEQWYDFLADSKSLTTGVKCVYRTRFFREVAVPLMDAYLARKAGRPWDVSKMPDCDWKLAFLQWADRRAK